MKIQTNVYPIISAANLKAILNDDHLVIFDCRFSLSSPESGMAEYETAHIPSSRYLHLDRDLSDPMGNPEFGRHPLPDPTHFASSMASKGVDDDSLVVVYDDSGGAFASRLWWMMKWLGHEAVSVLDGGWRGWLAAKGAVQTSISPVEKSTFARKENTALLARATELLDQDVNLIDSRSAERYSGEAEPIDPVAGHIPGAVNRPWMENLDEDGKFLSPQKLRARFADLDLADRTIFYCGSGVTACHNILATQIAGLPMPQLYAPSWSGWISDETRPVERAEGARAASSTR